MWIDEETLGYVDYVEKVKCVNVGTNRNLRPKEYSRILACHAQQLIFNAYSAPKRFYYPVVLPSRESLILGDAYWLTVYQLITSDVQHLEIRYSNLTEANLNQFLRHWLGGGRFGMKLLIVKMRNLDWNGVYRGLMTSILPRDRTFYYEGPLKTIHKLRFVRYYFRRQDGCIATVSEGDMNVFQFAVWPDANNQMIF
uniref:FBA_2 domain-containing protein n=1 Tax=Caenorhabditis tropicalis TaxID=1561998 RepID=A0A1I7UZ38_9PELO